MDSLLANSRQIQQSDCIEIDHLTLAVPLLMPASKISYLQSLLESYEGLATVRTISARAGKVLITFARDQQQDLLLLLIADQDQLAYSPVTTLTAAEQDKVMNWEKK